MLPITYEWDTKIIFKIEVEAQESKKKNVQSHTLSMRAQTQSMASIQQMLLKWMCQFLL